MMISNKKIVFLFCLMAFYANFSYGQNFTASGNWFVSVDATSINEAGEDLPTSHMSPSDATTLNMGGFFYFLFTQWQVDVSVNHISWHDQLELYIRRTGATPSWWSSIYGGTTFQLLTSNDQYFFQGVGLVYNMTIQYLLEGVSLVLPANQYYRTEIVFTLTEI